MEMLQDKDPEKSKRAMAALLTMKKLDIGALKKAFEDGDGAPQRFQRRRRIRVHAAFDA
jgi:hypothetical protein